MSQLKQKTVTCVFVHGWAMNSSVWDDCIARLPDWINVVLVDLPGHGSMRDVNVNSLDELVQALTPLVHRPVVWVGWSLGGLAVLRLAELYPQRVAAALLVSCSPCFVRREDWSCAVEAEVFDQFFTNLKDNTEQTLQRFLLLQIKGLPKAKQLVKQLQKSLQKRGQASEQALNTGLEILLKTDMRQALRNIEAELHWYLGSHDTLVPECLEAELQNRYAQPHVSCIKGVSHVPFISHEEDFIARLISIAERFR